MGETVLVTVLYRVNSSDDSSVQDEKVLVIVLYRVKQF